MRSISCCTSATPDAEVVLLAPLKKKKKKKQNYFYLVSNKKNLETLLIPVLPPELVAAPWDEAVLAGALTIVRLADDKSAVTRVIIIRDSNLCFKKSKIAFCIISVTSKPFKDGPTMITGRIDGTTS